MKEILKLVLIPLFILELLLLTTWMGTWGAHRSAIIFLICSLLIGILGIVFSVKHQENCMNSTVGNGNFKRNVKLAISILFCITGVMIIGDLLNDIFSSYVLSKGDVSKSDVIPLVMVMVERFTGGEFPYQPHTFPPGYTLRPTYMPLIWLPFSLAEWMNIDYRWIPASLLALSLILLQFNVVRKCNNIGLFIVLSFLPWFLWHSIISFDPDLFAITIENINVGYYIILCLTLVTRKPLLIGAGIAICLLSRYSFALWVPFIGFVYLVHDWKKLFKIVAMSLVMVLLIYIIPFLSQDPTMFFDSLASYTVAAVGEWAPGWQAEGEKPFHLFKGLGVAGIFYDNVPGELVKKIKILQVWHYLTSILILVPVFFIFLRFRKRLDLSLFLIASLKIYFVFFYNFIQVPYSYLFMVPVFISLIIVILSLMDGDKEVSIT